MLAALVITHQLIVLADGRIGVQNAVTCIQSGNDQEMCDSRFVTNAEEILGDPESVMGVKVVSSRTTWWGYTFAVLEVEIYDSRLMGDRRHRKVEVGIHGRWPEWLTLWP